MATMALTHLCQDYLLWFSLMHCFISLSISLVCKHKPFYSCHCNLRHIISQTKWSLSILFCLRKPRWLTTFDRCNYGLAIICTVALSVHFSLSEMSLWYGWELIWQHCHSVFLSLHSLILLGYILKTRECLEFIKCSKW